MTKKNTSFFVIILFLLPFTETSAFAPQDSLKKVNPVISLRFSGGPAIFSIDPGYYIQNSFIVGLSDHFAFTGCIGTGNAYYGKKNTFRWYVPGEELNQNDISRHQSILALNLGLQISLFTGTRHRLFMGMGPGVDFYRFSQTSVINYGDIQVYAITSKETNRVSLNYFGGYGYEITDRTTAGIEFYGMYTTENIYSILLFTAFRL